MLSLPCKEYLSFKPGINKIYTSVKVEDRYIDNDKVKNITQIPDVLHLNRKTVQKYIDMTDNFRNYSLFLIISIRDLLLNLYIGINSMKIFITTTTIEIQHSDFKGKLQTKLIGKMLVLM